MRFLSIVLEMLTFTIHCSVTNDLHDLLPLGGLRIHLLQARVVKPQLPHPQAVLTQAGLQRAVNARVVARLVVQEVDEVPVAAAGQQRGGGVRRGHRSGAALYLHDVHVAEGKAAGHLEQGTGHIAQAQGDAGLKGAACRGVVGGDLYRVGSNVKRVVRRCTRSSIRSGQYHIARLCFFRNKTQKERTR